MKEVRKCIDEMIFGFQSMKLRKLPIRKKKKEKKKKKKKEEEGRWFSENSAIAKECLVRTNAPFSQYRSVKN